jgi:hypothetical protein
MEVSGNIQAWATLPWAGAHPKGGGAAGLQPPQTTKTEI